MSIGPSAVAASHSARGLCLAEVCGDDLDLHALAGHSDRFKCIAAPRGQHKINAERREFTRNGRANATGCAGHQRALADVAGCVGAQSILLVM
jgi:hypothetical protein